MRKTAAGIAALGAAAAMAPAAHADVREVYAGVMAHDICIIDCKNANKEGSPNVEFQASFDSPHFLHWAGSPEPYVMASVSTTGDTSFGGFGLEWRWRVSPHWSVQPGLGYVVHNGAVNNPYPQGSPESVAYSDEHILFGSNDLFRTSLGVTYTPSSGPWEVQASYEHLSHGQILGHGKNQSTNELGLRIGYRFGE